MSTKNINKTLMMLVMIIKFSNLSQPPVNKDEPIDIKIYKGENDSSGEEEIIVLHLFVTPPELNITKTLIEPTLAPINQNTVVKIKPISPKKDKKTKLVNGKEVDNGKNVIRKETKENDKNKSPISKENEEEKELISENDNIEEPTIDEQSDIVDDSTSNNKDIPVNTKKSGWHTALVIVSILIAIFISGFFIVSISCSSTFKKKMFAFVPLCVISIAFGYLAKELLKVVPVLGLCLLFIVLCD